MHMRDIGVIGDKAMITTEGFYMGETWRSTITTSLASCRSGSIPRRASRMPCKCSGDGGIWVDFLNCIEHGGEPVATRGPLTVRAVGGKISHTTLMIIYWWLM